MSIEKLSDSSQVHIEQNPYTQVLNIIAAEIKDNDAFRIYVFLLSKSRNWEVVKEWTSKKCGVGERKAKQCWSYLFRCGLIDYIKTRDDKGMIKAHDLMVLNGLKFDQ